MRVRLVRRPGQHGTRAYVEQYGDQLICVRYRYDETTRRRYKTVEIIVEEKEWEPAGKGELKEAEQPPQSPPRYESQVIIEGQPKRPRQGDDTSEAGIAPIGTPAERRPRPAARSEPIGTPGWKPDTFVGVNVSPDETVPARQLRGLGAVWVERLKVWQITYAHAIALGLKDRIVGTISDIAATRVLRGGGPR